ncbi:MAG: CDP-alcohol phosphatidyltransferase family protein [Planctomycetaceae bacterium]
MVSGKLADALKCALMMCRRGAAIEYSFQRRMAAWSIHLLTASGAVWCLLAIDAVVAAEWRVAFGWLALAVAVDAVDGVLARTVGVARVVPGFDGALLDNIVDYVSYVFVPAFLMHRAQLFPPDWSLVLCGAICVASGYQFCQSEAKLPEHAFKGFPSYWNIVALYLLVGELPRVANSLVVLLLMGLVFVPIPYVYPTRTLAARSWTLTLTGLWGIAIVAIIWQLPTPSSWLVWASWLYVAYYVGLSLCLLRQTRR